FLYPEKHGFRAFQEGKKKGKAIKKTHKQLIISAIHNHKILAFLRAKNKLNDFIGTLAKLLPIF
ncbi:hypothetical protein, partial [Hoylesella saccharolytica]|uniref:hypothetical protein n=1 Tax=Hoylesella saccharolytica TaxID=633701 RepID=UPI0028EBF5C7